MEKDDEKQDVPLQDKTKPEAPDGDDDEGGGGPREAPPEPQKPEAPDWLYKNIEEVSKNAAKVYLVYMGFMAYAALTAISTPDRGLILNDKAHLPIVNIDVSANGFFIFAPLLVITIFLYLQIYLQRQMHLLAFLDTQYEPMQGRRLYPWIVNIAMYPNPGFMGKLQKLAVTLCIWIAPVVALNVISLSYIRKHDVVAVYAVALLALVGTLVIVFFWKAYGARMKSRRRKLAWVMIFFVVGFELFVLYPVIPRALEGVFFCVNLSYQKLVNEPSVDYPSMYWQNLRFARLEGANLEGSVLKRADLTAASLERAWLYRAILQGARLQGARLRGAILSDAFLNEAHLEEAHLEEAHLKRAHLSHAVLWRAHLEGAHLEEAYLDEAVLWDAVLEGAHLEGAHLVDAYLERANLTRANLGGANLWRAHLEGADFRGANLEGAYLRKADLMGARNLTIVQLSKVESLYEAKLDAALLEEVQKKCPHLLKKPKPDTQTQEKAK
jgi:uncharacterized protein YjbI with pentapeptide repeats